jgi:hypothetical protein
MKFCCERFQTYYEDPPDRLIYPAIKIVKISTDDKWPLRFFFLCGFVKDKPPSINMAYCPFCGNNLFKFYKSEAYINAKESDVHGFLA